MTGGPLHVRGGSVQSLSQALGVPMTRLLLLLMQHDGRMRNASDPLRDEEIQLIAAKRAARS